MDKNLTKFLKDLRAETQQVLDNTNSKIQGTASAVKDALLRPKSEGGTPKITGWLRSNWITSVDDEYLDVVGSQENVSTSQRESAWNDFLGMTDLYLHNNIYFNNNVWYGPIVDSGEKGQHFRKRAIDVGAKYLSSHRK